MSTAAVEYVTAGFVLVPLPQGEKAPTHSAWNIRERCITDPSQATRINGSGVGLAHAFSGTCAVDIDDYTAARKLLENNGVDLDALLAADDAVQIASGRENRAKLVYRMADPLPSKTIKNERGKDAINFRCASDDGKTIQDVLPPSIHPDTGKPYEWRGDWRRLPEIPEALLKVWRGLIDNRDDDDDQDTTPGHVGDFGGLSISDSTRKLIAAGAKTGTRSEAIFGAMKDLIRAGATDELVVGVLTDPANGISEKALEKFHGDQAGAAKWLKPQIEKARKEVANHTKLDFSEDGIALAFAGASTDLRYVARWNKWMQWNGTVWIEDGTLLAFDRVRGLVRKMAQHANTKQRADITKASTVAAIERLAKADRRLAATVDQWDDDDWILNTPGEIADLKTGTSLPHDPERYQTKQTAVRAAGNCPQWLAFLSDVMGGDQDMIAFLQRMVGYGITGSTREHALFFLYGTGGNGKGVFLNTLTGVVGDYAATASMDVFTESHHDRHPTELAMLRGARLVVAQETEEGRKWAESRIKALTGGNPITARFMRQDFFTFQPRFKLLIAGNHKPSLRNVDEAMRRRLHLVPFTVTVPPHKRDPDLAEKLKAEWPGILRWILDGTAAYLAEGVNPPAIVTEATAEYFSSQDLFAQWLEDCCEVGPSYWEASRALFNSWKRYAEAANEKPGDDRGFKARLENAGFHSGRTKKTRKYDGLRLIPEPVTPHWSDGG